MPEPRFHSAPEGFMKAGDVAAWVAAIGTLVQGVAGAIAVWTRRRGSTPKDPDDRQQVG